MGASRCAFAQGHQRSSGPRIEGCAGTATSIACRLPYSLTVTAGASGTFVNVTRVRAERGSTDFVEPDRRRMSRSTLGYGAAGSVAAIEHELLLAQHVTHLLVRGCATRPARGPWTDRAPTWYETRIALVPALPIDLLEATCRVVDEWNHDHTAAPWWRLYWNDRKGWVAGFRGKRYELGPQRIVVIAPETNFVARSATAATHFWVHFKVGPPLHSIHGAAYELAADEILLGCVSECRQALEEGAVTRAGLCVTAVCALALARLEGLPSLGCERTAKGLARLTAAAALPETKLPTNLELAREARMHPSSYVRWVKRELGTTPRAFMMARRIEQACALLRYTALPVEAIGERLGFCDRYHFSRTFRRARRLSPAAFRKGGI
jgi:AraC-like DNA-binding protein